MFANVREFSDNATRSSGEKLDEKDELLRLSKFESIRVNSRSL